MEMIQSQVPVIDGGRERAGMGTGSSEQVRGGNDTGARCGI